MQTLLPALLPAKPNHIRELQPAVLSAVGAVAGSARRQLSRTPGMTAVLGLAAPRRKSSFVKRHPVLVGASVLAVAAGGVLAIPRVRQALRQTSDRLADRLRTAFRRPAAQRGDGAAATYADPQEHQDELLDEGIEESFPASDPVSVKRIT